MAVNDKGYIDASPKPRAKGHKFTHQATQAGTGGGVTATESSTPSKGRLGWSTLDELHTIPESVWRDSVRAGLLRTRPTEQDLESMWEVSERSYAGLLRAISRPGATLDSLQGRSWTHSYPLGVTTPDSRQYMLLSIFDWLSMPWLHRIVRLTFQNGASGTGYIVGPRQVLTCAHGLFATSQNTQGPMIPPGTATALTDGVLDPAVEPLDWAQVGISATARVFYGATVQGPGNQVVVNEGSDYFLPSYQATAFTFPYPPIPTFWFTSTSAGTLGDVCVLTMEESFETLTKLTGWAKFVDIEQHFDWTYEYYKPFGGKGESSTNVGSSAAANIDEPSVVFSRIGYDSFGWDFTGQIGDFVPDPPMNLSNVATVPMLDPLFSADVWRRFLKGSGNKYGGFIFGSSDSDISSGASGGPVLVMPSFSNGIFTEPTLVGIANFGGGNIVFDGWKPPDPSLPPVAPRVPKIKYVGRNWFVGGNTIAQTIADASVTPEGGN